LKNSSEKRSVNNQVINAEYLLVAHAFIFNAVLTNTAVTGNHPDSHDAILETANHNTSLSFENGTLVICWAIFADIIVSRIPIIAITRETQNTFLTISKKSQKLFILIEAKIFKKGEKLIHLYWSARSLI
jgi:hypothetical protein